MRHSLIAVLAIATACASASPPPGGPEDKAPPQLIRVTPDTSALNVHDKFASFYFDETINDRGTGAQEIDAHFIISPSDGAPRVEWHRSRIDVRPRHGFRANTAYSVTLLAGLSDLRSNVMKTGATVVFSTGPSIPIHRIKGIIFDWIAERPAPLASLEAVSADSTIYLAVADTNGRFEIGPLNQGSYLLRGFVDANSNRALDRSEPFDTVRVVVPHSAQLVELLAAPRDTLAVRMSTVELSDSVTLRVTLDHPVDPTKPIVPAQFRLVAADSSVIPIAAVLNPLQERRADSVARQLSLDSLRRADSLAGKPLAPVMKVEAPAPQPNGRLTPPPPPKPSRPAPFSTVTIKVGKALPPSKDFRLSVSDLYSLAGRTQPSERRFTTPKPPPPAPVAKDSTATRPSARDSAAKTPASPLAMPPARPPNRR